MLSKIKKKIFQPMPFLALIQCDQGCELSDVLILIGRLIQYLFEFAAAIAIIYVIVAGYQYINSHGNPEGIEKAKSTLTWAVIGFIITISAFIIIKFVLDQLGAPGIEPPS